MTTHAASEPRNTAAAPLDRPRTLSVVILTHNEAHRLRPCLESVAWADEIVVIDAFSTDATALLVREFTPHLYESGLFGPDTPGGAGAARNFALTKTTGDWVFFLDSDERVTPELADEIRRVILHGPDQGHDAYRVPRLDYFFGVPATHIHGPAAKTRMIRRGRGRYDDRLVHEELEYEGTVGHLSGLMLHYTKDSVSHLLDTFNRYTSLEAQEAAKSGRPPAKSPWPVIGQQIAHWYYQRRGYRDGTLGLLLSLMYGFYAFLTWAKHWELAKNAGLVPAPDAPRMGTRVVGWVVGGLWRGLGRLRGRG